MKQTDGMHTPVSDPGRIWRVTGQRLHGIRCKSRAWKNVSVIVAWLVIMMLFVSWPQNGFNIKGPKWVFNVHPAQCQRARNIVYLKTHKCGSSTMLNILLRNGIANQLNFVLPKDGTNYIGHPKLFTQSLIIDMRDYNQTNNVIAHHTRFSKEAIMEVMPRDSFYITTLRRPEQVFESMFSYYNLERYFRKNVTAFVNDSNLTGILRKKRARDGKVGFNQMSFDLGLAPEQFDNATAVDEFINFIDRTFHLVMIVDRFDESIVLFKNLLCWRTEDVVAFKVNARKSTFRVPMAPAVVETLRALNSADTKLYEHFVGIFQEKVRAFGESRMDQEVNALRRLRQNYYDRCVEREDISKKLTRDEWSYQVLGFKLKEQSEKCRQMTMTELQFHKVLQRRQRDLVLNVPNKV
ncbi:galactosylceramide sulfotransferase-like isoform X2 [Ornithodoros turicata]|uniref:galactosylceramide sulfotransferase-like isoform X2 n=1 Tax=Ornithodoros turicata TaxID=34597 RepID=UPI003139818E